MMNKWQVATDPILLRRMGKTGEELSELLNVTNRIIIQGIDEIDPGSGELNRARLEKEIADVYAQLDFTVAMLSLNWEEIKIRTTEKIRQMGEWESLYQCKHEWVCADNEVVKGAEICTKCHQFRATDLPEKEHD